MSTWEPPPSGSRHQWAPPTPFDAGDYIDTVIDRLSSAGFERIDQPAGLSFFRRDEPNRFERLNRNMERHVVVTLTHEAGLSAERFQELAKRSLADAREISASRASPPASRFLAERRVLLAILGFITDDVDDALRAAVSGFRPAPADIARQARARPVRFPVAENPFPMVVTLASLRLVPRGRGAWGAAYYNTIHRMATELLTPSEPGQAPSANSTG